jgi:hypothetical protein
MSFYRRPGCGPTRCYVGQDPAQQHNPHVHVRAATNGNPRGTRLGALKSNQHLKVRDHRGYVIASVPGQVELQEYSAIRRITRSNTRNASRRHFFKFIQVSFELGSF